MTQTFTRHTTTCAEAQVGELFWSCVDMTSIQTQHDTGLWMIRTDHLGRHRDMQTIHMHDKWTCRAATENEIAQWVANGYKVAA